MIKIKRIYDQPALNDGKRILVDRLWPRGIKKAAAKVDEWLKDIAPSDDLRKWFSHDPAKWEEFRKRYREELKSKTEIVQKIRESSGKETVTFLYSAKDEEHNNAVALKDIVANNL